MQILDCTLRDGGYINNWNFSEDFAKAYCEYISLTGIDFIEIGLLCDANEHRLSACGPFRRITNVLASNLKNVSKTSLAVLIDYGKYDLNNLVTDCEDYISLVRVAVHKKDVYQGMEWCQKIRQHGYKCALQLMNFPSYTDLEIEKLVTQAMDSVFADYIYIADSYGAMTPSSVKTAVDILRPLTSEYCLGFHAHNNLQLAAANSFQAIESGCGIVDATVMGLGRGSGNLPLELLLMHVSRLQLKNIALKPAIQFAEDWVRPLLKEYDFGYSIKHACSGFLGIHPDYVKHTYNLSINDAYDFFDQLSKNNVSTYNIIAVERFLKEEK